jgi:transposase
VDKEQRSAAKARLVAHMQEGQPWQVAAETAGIQTSQSTAYRLLHAYRLRGKAVFQDERHGHPIKLRGAARAFLEERCQQAPHTPSSAIQVELQEQFNLSMSISQINRVRVTFGLSNHSLGRKQEKKP